MKEVVGEEVVLHLLNKVAVKGMSDLIGLVARLPEGRCRFDCSRSRQ